MQIGLVGLVGFIGFIGITRGLQCTAGIISINPAPEGGRLG